MTKKKKCWDYLTGVEGMHYHTWLQPSFERYAYACVLCKSTPKPQNVLEESGQPVEEKHPGRCRLLTSILIVGGEFIGIHPIISKSS